MTPSEFDALGDKHKQYEKQYQETLTEGLPFVVRLDGRSFHTYTRGLARPYDAGMSRAMEATMKALVEEFHPTVGFTQSDEITLVFANQTSETNTQMIFGGKVSKILSNFAAFASVEFFKQSVRNLPEDKWELTPTFDARVMQYETLELAAENVMWRETDAIRNSVTMAASAYFSHKELQGKGHTAKLRMLKEKGVEWNAYPTHFKQGIFARRVTSMVQLTDNELLRIPEKFRPESNMVARTSVQLVELKAEKLEAVTEEQRIQFLFN
jgi:tRNA(His) 5'-end guanylyltransferase